MLLIIQVDLLNHCAIVCEPNAYIFDLQKIFIFSQLYVYVSQTLFYNHVIYTV